MGKAFPTIVTGELVRPASVLMFVADLSATGVVRNAIAIANRLCMDGMHVTLAASIAEGALKDGLDPAIDLVGLLPRRAARTPRALRLIRAWPAFRRLALRTRPDILFSAGNHGHVFCWLAVAGLAETRTLYRVSNDLSHPGERRSLSAWLGGKLRGALLSRIAAGADRIILVSPHLGSQLGADEARVRIIPNGVDGARVRRDATAPCDHPWLAEDAPPTIVAVGRLVRQKNFATLIDAVAIASRTRQLRLVIIGGGTNEAHQALLARAGERGIADSVDLIGPVANPFPYVRRAAAFALPSLWEGASNVLLEAIACGVPVVASHMAGNAADVLDDGRYGMLVDPQDATSMAEALLRQAGPNPIRPENRADAFDRGRVLSLYSETVSALADMPSMSATAPPKISRAHNPEGRLSSLSSA